MRKVIGIVDYKVGNLLSIANIFKSIGAKVNISSDSDILSNSDLLVLPGVGSFAAGMLSLKSSRLDKFIIEISKTNKNILGICLGMQLLFQSSDEGHGNGLSLVPGIITQFDFNNLTKLKLNKI